MDCRDIDHNLKIYTLNCWGLQYVSKHRQQRIKLIAEHLVDHKYDIVFLQEIWIQSDFDYIRKATESEFKFSHFFKNGSVLGNSGLAVLVKWVPKAFHFHPFSVNGSPFRVTHGDWYTSKGVGYIRVELDSLNLHLFCTHMHAQYNLSERLNDQYSVHRICQSYEMSKFIKLMTNHRSNNCKDLVVLAGDLNASSKELPFQLLVGLTELNDCFKYRTKAITPNDDIGEGDCAPNHNHLSHECSDSETDDEYHTCGHRDNKFTEDSSGKRIDFILYRYSDQMNNRNNEIIAETYTESLEDSLCGVEYISLRCKDQTGLPFSDHQPVVAQFKIKSPEIVKTFPGFESPLNHSLDSPSTFGDNCLSGGNKEANNVSNGCGSTHYRKVHEKRGSGETGGEGNDSNDMNKESTKSDRMGLLSGKPKLKCNVLLELADTASKFSKCGPLQLKHIASNAIKSRLQRSSSSNRQTLDSVKSLLEEYVAENQMSFKYFLFTSLFLFVIISLISSTLWVFIQLPVIEVLFVMILLTITPILANLLKFLASRQEINAIKAIVNDIEKEIFLYQ